jgi:hypothetical protein
LPADAKNDTRRCHFLFLGAKYAFIRRIYWLTSYLIYSILNSPPPCSVFANTFLYCYNQRAYTHKHIESTAMSTLTNSNPARWNLVISEQTNIAVRSFLALKGFKKGDLSSFVEEAVRWRVFDQTLTEARSGFDDLPIDEAQSMMEEALAEVRAEGLAAGRYAAVSAVPANAAKKV